MEPQAPTYSLTEYFGGKDTEGYKSYKEGQKSGKWADLPSYLGQKGQSLNSGSNASTIQSAVNMAQQVVQPAVTALKEEAGPLKERYQNLINSLKGQQQTETERQTVTTNAELARRGVQGGLADQTLTNALNPITRSYSGQIADMGLQGISAERNLASQIAQLQSQAGLTGLSQGYGNQQFNQSQALQQQQLANQIAQQKADQEFQNKVYETIQLPTSKANIADTNSLIANRGSATGGMSLADFLIASAGGQGVQSSSNGGVSIGGKNYSTLKLNS